GYLTIKHNFDKSGGQRPSTISVRVPAISIEHAKKKKDRVNKKLSINNETLLMSNENAPFNEDFTEECPVNVIAEQSDSSDSPVLCGTFSKSEDINTFDSPRSENFPNEIDLNKEDTSSLSFPEVLFHPRNDQDKNDRGGYDINVIQKEKNKKEFN